MLKILVYNLNTILTKSSIAIAVIAVMGATSLNAQLYSSNQVVNDAIRTSIEFVVDNSDYSSDKLGDFAVNLISSEEMAEIHPIAIAGYDPKTRTIYLNENFDPSNIKHMSTVVHEVYHVFQYFYSEERAALCEQALERNAYLMQMEYIALHDETFDMETDGLNYRRMAVFASLCPDFM